VDASLSIIQPGASGVRHGRTAQAGRAGTPREAHPGSGVAAGELAAEVARLLRVRRGELAEPLAWQRTWLRLRVAAVLTQLQPIRSHGALASSWEREARRGPDVRLAYAMAWLASDRDSAQLWAQSAS
jgi:hypothetical protein